MALLLSPEVSLVSCRRCEAPAGGIIPHLSTRNVPPGIRVSKCEKGAVGVAIRANLSVEDLEDAKVLNLERRNAGFQSLGPLLSAPVKQPGTAPSSKPSKEEEEKRNYHLNTGYAIRTLREEFPALFYKELSYDIYRALWIDIISVWQPVDNMIMVRWTVHGIPRIPWESHGRFDGISEYKLDKNGKIYEHQVHNIALHVPPKFRVLAVEDLIRSIGCPSTPKPTYFETSSSFISKLVQQVKFKGIKHCVSLLFPGVQESDAE